MPGVYDKIVRRETGPDGEAVTDPLVPEPSGGVSLIRRFPRRRGLNPAFKLRVNLDGASTQVRRGRR